MHATVSETHQRARNLCKCCDSASTQATHAHVCESKSECVLCQVLSGQMPSSVCMYHVPSIASYAKIILHIHAVFHNIFTVSDLLHSKLRMLCCLQVLHVGRQIPVTVTLHNIIEKSFPVEFAERRAEMMAHEEAAADRPDAPVPLCVMCCMMPGRSPLRSVLCVCRQHWHVDCQLASVLGVVILFVCKTFVAGFDCWLSCHGFD